MAEIVKDLHAHFGSLGDYDILYKRDSIDFHPATVGLITELVIGNKAGSPIGKQPLEVFASKDPDFIYRTAIFQGEATRLKIKVVHNPTQASVGFMKDLQHIICEGVGHGIVRAGGVGAIDAAASDSLIGVINITLTEPFWDSSRGQGKPGAKLPTVEEARQAANDPNDPQFRRRIHRAISDRVLQNLTQLRTQPTFEDQRNRLEKLQSTGKMFDYIT